MKIASHQLQAFFVTSQLRHFTKAAAQLGLTQSALSQRIANLEADLEVTLFIRDRAGPTLTEAGEILFRYCQTQDSLEGEILSQLKSNSQTLAGRIRIAAFSSVHRSVIIPALGPFLRKHPAIQCEFKSFEVSELYSALKNAEADLIVSDSEINYKGVVHHSLGQEVYVVIESAKHPVRANIYLDHGASDPATAIFFAHQSSAPKKYQRNYMGDVYGIISGVELGLGRAVMSKHLLKNNKAIRFVPGFKKYAVEVKLHYFEQPYYSKLHSQIVNELIKTTPELFKI